MVVGDKRGVLWGRVRVGQSHDSRSTVAPLTWKVPTSDADFRGSMMLPEASLTHVLGGSYSNPRHLNFLAKPKSSMYTMPFVSSSPQPITRFGPFTSLRASCAEYRIQSGLGCVRA